MKLLCIFFIATTIIFASLWIVSKTENNNIRIQKIESDQRWAGEQYSLRLQLNRLVDIIIATEKKIGELEEQNKKLKGPII